MVTVEADVVRVESRLVAGEIPCPTCRDGVLGDWGVCAGPADRGTAQPGAAATGAVPSVHGHPRVVADDRVVAESV